MILIADSGSTKTDWALCPETSVEGGNNLDFELIKTQGINPFYQHPAQIINLLQFELFPSLGGKRTEITHIYFYGAGCTAAKIPEMEQTLAQAFAENEGIKIKVEGDLLAAARAAYGHEAGIACILGTGANTGWYDGERILKNIPPLGFILGDEGSGAALGKLFLNAAFKEALPEHVRDAYLAETHQTYADVIDRVYRQPLPNRYLASIAKFVSAHLEEFSLQPLVEQNFQNFFDNNICRYTESTTHEVSVVGSVAIAFEPILRQVARTKGYTIKNILAAPLEGLVQYHTKG